MKMKRSNKNKIEEINWPVIEVNNFEETVKFYINTLGFELEGEISNLDKYKTVKLKFFDFYLILKKGSKGPIYEQSKNVLWPIKTKCIKFPFGIKFVSIHPIKDFKPTGSPTLEICVPDLKDYYNIVKNKEIRVLTEIEPIGPVYLEKEGFHILDSEGNKICFFTDAHGPYKGDYWQWSWQE